MYLGPMPSSLHFLKVWFFSPIHSARVSVLMSLSLSQELYASWGAVAGLEGWSEEMRLTTCSAVIGVSAGRLLIKKSSSLGVMKTWMSRSGSTITSWFKRVNCRWRKYCVWGKTLELPENSFQDRPNQSIQVSWHDDFYIYPFRLQLYVKRVA